MLEPQGTEEAAQTGSEATSGASTATAERPESEASPGSTEAPKTVAELTALLEAERAGRADDRKATAKAIADAELARKGQSASDKKLAERIAQGDPVARARALAADVRAARAEAVALNKDPDDAERAVKQEHQDDDRKQATERTTTENTAWVDARKISMGEALTEAGLTGTDWNDPKNKAMRSIKNEWLNAINQRDTAWADQLESEVKAMKKADAEPVVPAPKVKTRAQREAELDGDGGGGSGGGTGGAAAYRKKLLEGKPVSAEEIDRLTAAFLNNQ